MKKNTSTTTLIIIKPKNQNLSSLVGNFPNSPLSLSANEKPFAYAITQDVESFRNEEYDIQTISMYQEKLEALKATYQVLSSKRKDVSVIAAALHLLKKSKGVYSISELLSITKIFDITRGSQCVA